MLLQTGVSNKLFIASLVVCSQYLRSLPAVLNIAHPHIHTSLLFTYSITVVSSACLLQHPLMCLAVNLKKIKPLSTFFLNCLFPIKICGCAILNHCDPIMLHG